MKISASKLFSVIKTVRFTEPSTLPVLNHVHFSVSYDEVVVTTTNLDIGKRERVLASSKDVWETCVPMISIIEKWQNGKRVKNKKYPFYDFLNTCDKDEILTFEYDKRREQITITSGNSKTIFKCLNSKEFPPSERYFDEQKRLSQGIS